MEGMALFVSLCALLISGFTWYMVREQNRAIIQLAKNDLELLKALKVIAKEGKKNGSSE